jgi:hypothetical protein
LFRFKSVVPPRRSYHCFFQEIANFISSRKGTYTDFWFDEFTLPLMVKYLWAIVVKHSDRSVWDSNLTAGFVDRPSSTISDIIDGKTIKAAEYRNTDELWLAIERSGKPSETILPIKGIDEFSSDSGLCETITNSPFSKVYVFTAMGLFQGDRDGGWHNVRAGAMTRS